ncbi:hypothetical protein A3D03_05895 [Candidatus Gottesmanbacteria bacterium RIFCSPHIGHO2_02_FULL_40_13]|uniref:ribose-phosphate diphosphokinase n=1 Tax=Candidatus Gottesmanbacteria bacterium RIFCSPHIGHO2_02_FULL_40_13 TaxID=1798384 RepID=A0A1F6ABY5_9BACT|nr:MAG: hypothetical protein A3D03_05895 [Candidatus Gottesmanbacteria bacterium RIFCSPHIGHO2_02_FULL_40_13]
MNVEALLSIERPGPPKTILITDSITQLYHPNLLEDIMNGSGYTEFEVSRLDRMGDLTTRSILPGVSSYPERNIQKAIIVGFVTGPKLDENGETLGEVIFPGDPIAHPVSMAERMHQIQLHLNSLLHHNPPWVQKTCLVLPHFESRSDRDAVPGEGVEVETLTDGLAGARRKVNFIVTLGDHSHRLHTHLARNGIKHVSISGNQFMAKKACELGLIDENTIIASPDIGAARLADDFAIKCSKLVKLPKPLSLLILNKTRNLQEVNQSQFQGILRNVDVAGKRVIIRDDEGDSLRTNVNVIKELKKRGAKSIILIYTHAVHSKGAKDRLVNAIQDGLIDAVVVTDSRPHDFENKYPQDVAQKIHVIKVGKLMGSVAASLLDNGLKATRKAFQDYLFEQFMHPLAALREINWRRNGSNIFLYPSGVLFPNMRQEGISLNAR